MQTKMLRTLACHWGQRRSTGGGAGCTLVGRAKADQIGYSFADEAGVAYVADRLLEAVHAECKLHGAISATGSCGLHQRNRQGERGMD